MEHREAKLQNVAMRYMAGELSARERERFEGHYFECALCAHDVREMVAAAGPATEPVAAPSLWRRLETLWQWPPAATRLLVPACLVLAFVSYEALHVRDGLTPQSVMSYHLSASDARGAGDSIDRSGEFVVLTADVPELVREFKWELRSAEGAGLVLEGVATSQPGRVTLLIPVSRLKAATYVLSLRDTGLIAPELTYRFRMH
jgi:hypothetical protein